MHRKMEGDEWEKTRDQIWMIDGQPRQLDKIVGRRKKKRSYEYEVCWKGLSSLCFNRCVQGGVLFDGLFGVLVEGDVGTVLQQVRGAGFCFGVEGREALSAVVWCCWCGMLCLFAGELEVCLSSAIVVLRSAADVLG